MAVPLPSSACFFLLAFAGSIFSASGQRPEDIECTYSKQCVFFFLLHSYSKSVNSLKSFPHVLNQLGRFSLECRKTKSN